jgi:hypothetical protein
MSQIRTRRLTTEKGELDKALEERATLLRQYRVAKNAHRQKLFAESSDLSGFAQHLRRISDPSHMQAYVREMARGPFSIASPEIRLEALSLVSERIVAIRLRAGLPPFDDPVLDEPDRVFQVCKEMLR